VYEGIQWTLRNKNALFYYSKLMRQMDDLCENNPAQYWKLLNKLKEDIENDSNKRCPLKLGKTISKTSTKYL
jgi:hypothetical protein